MGNRFDMVKRMLSGQGMAAIQANLLQNPAFQQFVADNQGKSFEEVCRRYNVDTEEVKKLMK